jgi:hypothetical protein
MDARGQGNSTPSTPRSACSPKKANSPTKKTEPPIPYIVKFDNGAEYAVTVGKALNQQNGQFRNGSGQVVEGTQNNNGGIQSSSVQSQDYLLNGTISRIKGSDGALRIWFNYGAERGFSKDWITRPDKGAAQCRSERQAVYRAGHNTARARIRTGCARAITA